MFGYIYIFLFVSAWMIGLHYKLLLFTVCNVLMVEYLTHICKVMLLTLA